VFEPKATHLRRCFTKLPNYKIGLHLLPISTVLEKEKTLTLRTGTHPASGHKVRGYEIHHGETRGESANAPFLLDSGEPAGAMSGDGRIWGSYLHGVFDSDPFRRWFIDQLRCRKGLQPVGRVLAPYDLEPALDRLAAIVRSQLDMDFVYRLLGI